jgi:hypothetical protein
VNNVLLIDHAAEKPKTDFRLIRLCEWAGFSLKDFERVTINDTTKIPTGSHRVVVPMGPRAIGAAGVNRPILECRGYLWTTELGYVIPTVSPGYIQRGNAKWSAAFIADLQKAVHLGSSGLPVHYNHYVLDPSPLRALEWAKEYVRELDRNPALYLAFDIETPGKGDDEEELDGEHDRTWIVERIGFSYQAHAALSIPWAPEYYAAIRLILSTHGPKVVWNAGFDVPRVRRAGFDIHGTIHDGMVAWHILHSDLPKALRFVATFTCPWQPAWKHLSGAKPAFYNATDADVEYRSMVRIEEELRRTGMWEVYEKDVVELEPILVHMHRMGMPVDSEIRLDRAIKLDNELHKTRAEMEACVPLEARAIDHVYVNTPKVLDGLLSRPGTREIPRCPRCGHLKPRKDHFKQFVKKHNPCAGATPVLSIESVTEYYRLSDFTPSRDQLIRYHQLLNRPCLRTYDKKERRYRISFAEKQIKELRLKYPDDRLYELVLTYRSLDKLAGTYIGRPIET